MKKDPIRLEPIGGSVLLGVEIRVDGPLGEVPVPEGAGDGEALLRDPSPEDDARAKVEPPVGDLRKQIHLERRRRDKPDRHAQKFGRGQRR